MSRDGREPASAYAGVIVEQAPRVLGLMDREALSATGGCCDRTYWAWKFVDFPRSRFQEALCVLAFLHATPLPNSPYAGSQHLLEWIERGLEFWCAIQHRDGSFDEAYPFERSLAATAFTTFYVGEALELTGSALKPETLAKARESMIRAGRWLKRNDETHGFLSNHLAAAAGALQLVHRQSGDEAFARRSRYFVDRILEHQSTEGWYDEYGGADPGYQTHGTFYLARYWQRSPDAALALSLERAVRFQAAFVHADGSIGGEYASRNTQTYYPAAFEILAERDTAAAWIAETMRPSLLNGAAVGPGSVDAYNYFPFLNNLVFAHLAAAARSGTAPATREPFADQDLLWFPKAGLARIRRERYDAYVGVAKGGVLKIFDRKSRSLVYSDCGYVGTLKSGQTVSTQYQEPDRRAQVSADGIEVEGRLSRFRRPTLTPLTFIAFRIFTLSIGRHPILARWLKQQLVNVLVYRRRTIDVRFARTIRFGATEVTVRDDLCGPDADLIETLRWEPRFTTIHMGSSRYFIANELLAVRAEPPDGTPIAPAAIRSGLTVQRRVNLGGAVPIGNAHDRGAEPDAGHDNRLSPPRE